MSNARGMRLLLLAVVLTCTALAAPLSFAADSPGTDGDGPLLEVRRIALPWPRRIDVMAEGKGWSLVSAWHPRSPVIVELEAHSFRVLRQIPYRDEAHPEWYPVAMAWVHPEGDDPLLVVAGYFPDQCRVFAVGDVPEERASLDFSSHFVSHITEVGDDRCVIVETGHGGGPLFDVKTARRLLWLPSHYTLAGPPDHRLVLSQGGGSPWHERIRVRDLSDPENVRIIRDIPNPSLNYPWWQLTADASFALWHDEHGKTVHVVDLVTGEELATFPRFSDEAKLVLSDTAAGRYALLVDFPRIESWDLRDPSDPRRVTSVDLDLCPEGETCEPAWALSSTDPLLFVADPGDSGVAALDVPSLGEIARWRTDLGRPSKLLLRERPGETRELLVTMDRATEDQVLATPGLEAQALVDWSIPGEPREIDSVVLVNPRVQVEYAGTLGGRWVASWHPDVGAVVVVDTAAGRVTGYEGLHERADLDGKWPKFYAGGNRVVVRNGAHHAEVFEVVDGVPRWLGAYSFPGKRDPWFTGAAAREDGLTALAFNNGLLLVRPDGTVASSVETPLYGARKPRFSRDGKLLLVEGDHTWSIMDWLAMYDVSDPTSPRLLWSRDDVRANSVFVHDGNAIACPAATWDFSVVLLDTLTGRLLGERSGEFPGMHMEGNAVAMGEGETEQAAWTVEMSRSVYSRTLVYDVSGDTPRVVLTSAPFTTAAAASFGHVELADRSGFREFHEIYNRPTLQREYWFYRPDGTVEDMGRWPVRRFYQRLRRGFLVTGDTRDPGGFVVWRDPAMNRPPEARAGGDQVLECAGPAGTPTTLDGSGTTDPDSTPGTQDDLAAFRWEEAGERLCEGVTCEASFAVGEHVVTLEAEDVLGAVGTDDVTVTVQDTLPPEVGLTVDPQVEQGNGQSVFLGTWVADGSVTDRCDGDLGRPLVVLLEDPAVLGAPWRYEPAEEERVVVLAGEAGPEVVLYGPSEALVVEHWTWAVEHGGWQVQPGWPTSYWWGRHAPSPLPAGVLEEVLLAPSGEVLAAQRSEAYGDFVFEGRGEDAAGHGATARVSLRERVAEACAGLPPGTDCRW